MFFFSSLRCGLLVHAICDKQDSLLRSAVNCTVAIIDRTAVVIDLFVENCDFCLPRLHSTPPLYRNIAVMFGAEKLKRCGYLKMKKNENTFIPFDRIRTWRTGRRTDTAWRHRPRLCIASHGNNWTCAAECIFCDCYQLVTRLLIVELICYRPSHSHRWHLYYWNKASAGSRTDRHHGCGYKTRWLASQSVHWYIINQFSPAGR